MTQEFYHNRTSTSITLNLTAAEIELLTWLAGRSGIDSAASLIEAFIGDLTSSARSGGTDEREMAFDWFVRRFATEAISAHEAVQWRRDAEETEEQLSQQAAIGPYVTVPTIARLFDELRRRWIAAGGVPFTASHRQLARDLGFASVGHIPEIMRRLEADGHIERLPKPNGQGFLIALRTPAEH